MVEHEGECIYEEISVHIDAQLKKKLEESQKSLKEKNKRNGFLRWPLSVFSKGDKSKNVKCLTEGDDTEKDNIYECIPVKVNRTESKELAVETIDVESKEFVEEEWENESVESDQQEYVVVTNEDFICSPLSSSGTDVIPRESTDYAEIVIKQEVHEISPASRPTRDSDNPILRQDFGMLAGETTVKEYLNDKSISPSGENLVIEPVYVNTPSCTPRDSPVMGRKSLNSESWHPERNVLYENTQFLPGTSPKSTQPCFNSEALYENTPITPKLTRNHSPCLDKVKRSNINYENIPLPARPVLGRCYSMPSNSCCVGSPRDENKRFSPAIEDNSSSKLYENVENNEKRPRKSSKPIDILIYSDIDFAHMKSKSGLNQSYSNSSSFDACSLNSVTTNSSSGSSNTSPVLLRRSKTYSSHSRQRELSHVLKYSTNAFGVYSGKFVGSVPAHRSNIHTIETLIRELASRFDNEESSCVNIEATCDVLRVSTKSSPYDVVVSAEVDSIECIALNNLDSEYVGFIVGGKGREAFCYVLYSTEAEKIHEAVNAAFRNSPAKVPSTSSSTSPPCCSTPPNLGVTSASNPLNSFHNITYLGSLKVKKSYLVINNSIEKILNKADPRDYQNVTMETHRDVIKVYNQDFNMIGSHSTPWILSLGVFDQDHRLFGYIVSEAYQGEKTRMNCHVFRCGRVESAAHCIDAIKKACQMGYVGYRESPIARRRLGSSSSSNSVDSLSSTETMSSAQSCDDEDGKFRHHRQFSMNSLKRRLTSQKRLSTSSTSSLPTNLSRGWTSERVLTRQEKESSLVERKQFQFDVSYVCSTIINPPLRGKHVKVCLKQYQKEMAKNLKTKNSQTNTNRVTLTLNAQGVILESLVHSGQKQFFPWKIIDLVKQHPDNSPSFAFSTIVSGNTKHKCHVFMQAKEQIEDIIEAFQTYLPM